VEELTDKLKKDQQPLKIIIADDHALVRGGLALVVNMASFDTEILQANNFKQVIVLLREAGSLDLIMLDLMMPGMDNENSINTIRKIQPDLPIIIVSVKEDHSSIQESLAAGASGYIPKTSSPSVTVSAIKLVLAGGIYVPPHVLNTSETILDSAPLVEEQTKTATLSKRQIEVLTLITLGKSNQMIADELVLSIPTIKMHVSAIFKKLSVKNRTEAVSKYAALKHNN